MKFALTLILFGSIVGSNAFAEPLDLAAKSLREAFIRSRDPLAFARTLNQCEYCSLDSYAEMLPAIGNHDSVADMTKLFVASKKFLELKGGVEAFKSVRALSRFADTFFFGNVRFYGDNWANPNFTNGSKVYWGNQTRVEYTAMSPEDVNVVQKLIDAIREKGIKLSFAEANTSANDIFRFIDQLKRFSSSDPQTSGLIVELQDHAVTLFMNEACALMKASASGKTNLLGTNISLSAESSTTATNQVGDSKVILPPISK